MTAVALLSFLFSVSLGVRVNRKKVAVNETSEWSPCLRGMCYASWGAYRKPENFGVGGRGNNGCAKPISGKCPYGSKRVDCVFGPCPKFFGSPACVSTSGCRSYCDVQHAGTCRYTGPVERPSNGATWMRGFQDVRLNRLLVAGAHHGLAKLGTLDFLKPATKDIKVLDTIKGLAKVPGFGDVLRVATASLLPMMSSTQSASVSTLLNSGVRMLDMRPFLSAKDNKLFDSHGGRGSPIEEALAEVANFAKGRRSEIVYVQFSNLMWDGKSNCLDCQSKSATFNRLTSAVQRYFGSCGGGTLLCNVDLEQTVGQLTARGNVIVWASERELASSSRGLIHNKGAVYSDPWYNTNSLSDLKKRVLGDDRLQRTAAQQKHLISHQWIMSPNDKDFIGAISQKATGNWQDQANPHGCQSLACFAGVASAAEFSKLNIASRYKRSNVLLLDFADRTGTMSAILEHNNRYARS